MSKNRKRPTFVANPKRKRLIISFLFFTICFSALLVRLLIFQVIQNEKLQSLTKSQDTKTVKLTSPRGTIFDKNMRALAVSIKVPSIYVDPQMLEISKDQTQKLLALLEMDLKQWKNKIDNKKRRFAWLKRKMNPNVEQKIRQLNIRGVGVISEWDRLYPDREFASQVIGFVNLDGKGLEGLERQYEKSLFSHGVELTSQKDAKGRAILYGKNINLERRKGFDITLTIDSAIQYFLEDELAKASIEKNVKAAFGTILNPHTGEVLAMASYPQMNLNRIDQSSAEERKNRNVLDVFEPGSTFKPFVMTQALEEKVISPGQEMNCKEGSLWIGKKKIRNIVDKDFLTPQGIIKFSNNVCMAKIGIDMGEPLMTKMIDNFGFAQKTGIDFPVESTGLFDRERKWRDMRLANLAFGQGISVTAIQMVRAMSVIANGGWLVQPYMVEEMITGTGQVVDMGPKARKKKVFSKETIENIQSFLTAVTDEDGTGKNARVDGYQIAGKTGTAQIFDFEKNAYSHKKVVSSFLGYAPAENPKLVAYIVLYQPQEGEFGGTIAAPVFSKVMSRVLPYMHVQPQAQEAVATTSFLRY